MHPSTTRLSFYVSSDLHRRAKVIAHLEDETLSSVMSRLLRQYVESMEPKYDSK